MMDGLHRILAGNPARRPELIAAGIFVAVWFVIDVIQFSDWVWSKFNPPQTAICIPIPRSSREIPLYDNLLPWKPTSDNGWIPFTPPGSP